MAWKPAIVLLLLILTACMGVIATLPRERLPNWLHFLHRYPTWIAITIVVLPLVLSEVKDYLGKEAPAKQVITVPAMRIEGELQRPPGLPGEEIVVGFGTNDFVSLREFQWDRLFSAQRDASRKLLISVVLYDKDGRLIANIDNNKFRANPRELVHLDDSDPMAVRIYGGGVRLTCRMTTSTNAVLEGEFYMDGQEIKATERGLFINGSFFYGNVFRSGPTKDETDGKKP